MERQKITIELPSEILPLVAARRKDVPTRILEYLILELYRLGEISSGKAGQCLGMERFEFIRFASRLGIPYIDMDSENQDVGSSASYTAYIFSNRLRLRRKAPL